jgi:hypothetical protein
MVRAAHNVSRARPRAIAVLLAGVACAAGCGTISRTEVANPTPRPPAPRVASKQHRWAGNKNLVCAEFCSRIASCWYAVPRADQTLSQKAVETACLREESNCQGPTKDTHCCGFVSSCQEFLSCQTNSRGVASDCKYAPSLAGEEEPASFESANK